MRDKRLDNRPTASHEFLLMRVGHHLWREYKSRKPSNWPDLALLDALQTVWAAKAEVRAVLHKEWLESREKQANRLREYRYRGNRS